MAEQVSRTVKAERIDADAIAALPALLTTTEAASITGVTPLFIAKKCADGTYQAAKVGRSWRLNKAKFLAAVGMA